MKRKIVYHTCEKCGRELTDNEHADGNGACEDGCPVSKRPTESQLIAEMENSHSEIVRVCVSEMGRKPTNKLIRECMSDHLGDKFFDGSWDAATVDAFRMMVNKVTKNWIGR